jgi:hypothetical protein
LATPILWACFDAECTVPIPAAKKNSIRLAYAALNSSLGPDVNPVEKRRLLVSNLDGTLEINEVGALVNAAAGNDNADAAGHHHVIPLLQHEMQTMNTRLGELERRQTNMEVTGHQILQQVQQLGPIGRKVDRISTAVQRIAAFPVAVAARQQQAAAAAGAEQDDDAGPVPAAARRAAAREIPFECTLSKTPATLYLVWREYTHGLAGRKPAKNFNCHERGAVKHVYSRRKVIWDQVSELVRAGDTPEVAIDRIYNVYGVRTSVTSIINQLRTDRMNGGPAALRL